MFKLFALALVALIATAMVNSAPILPRRPDLYKPDCESDSIPSPTLSGPPASSLLAEPTSSPAPEPSPTPASGDVDYEDGDDNNDDDGDDDCEDEPSSPAYEPSSTPASVPTPSGNPELTPTPTPTPSPEPSSSSSTDDAAPSPTPTSGNSDNSGTETHTGGDLTWFTQNGVAGACGVVHSDSDFIAALDVAVYGDTSVQSSYCGKTIRIEWQGNSVDVVVADACPTCNNAASVDLSEAAFQALAPLSTGLLTDATWTLLN